MTLQVDRPLPGVDADVHSGDRRRRWRLMAVALAVAVVAAVTAVLQLTTSGTDHPVARVTLGRSLIPVKVFRVERLSEPRADAQPGKAQRAVPVLGRPEQVAVIGATPDQLLHVRYAHVRTVAGSTQIEVAAPDEAAFHDSRVGEQHYVVLVDGQAAALFFVFGSADETNFAFAGGLNPISHPQATAFAHRVTTAVATDG